MHKREQERIAVMCLLELERMGLRIEVLQDFARVPAEMEALGRKLGIANDPRRLLLTKANAMWLVAYRTPEGAASEVPVIGFGIRLDDLGEEDAESFVARSLNVLFGAKVRAVRSDIFAGRRWGRAAYLGALTSGASVGLGRNTRKIIQLMTAYAHYRAFADLAADTTYCFLRAEDAAKGVAYGFMTADAFVWETEAPIFSDGNPGWVMSTRKRQMPSVMIAASRLLS